MTELTSAWGAPRILFLRHIVEAISMQCIWPKQWLELISQWACQYSIVSKKVSHKFISSTYRKAYYHYKQLTKDLNLSCMGHRSLVGVTRWRFIGWIKYSELEKEVLNQPFILGRLTKNRQCCHSNTSFSNKSLLELGLQTDHCQITTSPFPFS